MGSAKPIATCAIMAALTVVIMLLGALLELGIYAAPMLAGLCLMPIGKRYGCKYHIMLWVAASILCFLLVPSIEENLIFAGLLGWYPIVQPRLQRLPRLLRLAIKLLIFNAAIIAIETLVLLVFLPEVLGFGILAALLALGNLTFLLYDRLIPSFTALVQRILGRR
ncbi:MAG: hypothetical protein J6Q53_03140 [Oscillospiraceae bacterium]|nr:hypothetical protein [Oscillospiraceae bacterium]